MTTKSCTICNGSLMYGSPEKKCFRCNDTGRVPESWIEPNNPPLELIQEIGRKCGYNIVVHGSQMRDYDIIAVPWEAEAVGCRNLVDALCKGLNAKIIDRASKPHARYAFNLQMDGYYKLIDLSVTPTLKSVPHFPHHFKPNERVRERNE